MGREEALGLGVSVAMHAATLMALQIDGQPHKQERLVQEVELVVLPTEAPPLDGLSTTDADDNCSEPPMSPRSPQEVETYVDIAAGPLAVALRSLSAQTGLAYTVEADALANRRAIGLRGLYTPREAASRILNGTGLCSIWMEGGLVVRRCGATVPGASTGPSFGASAGESPCGSEEPSAAPGTRALPPASYA